MPTTRTSRLGFTLIELLLVMSIIAVLASLSLVVIGEAQYDAQANATRSRINQISTLMQESLEEYAFNTPEFYADDVSLRISEEIDVDMHINDPNGADNLRVREVLRRMTLESISAEMPRSHADIAHNRNGNETSFPSPEFVSWFNDQNHFIPLPYGKNLIPLQIFEAMQLGVTFLADQFRNPAIGDESADKIANPAFPDANESDLTDDDPTTNFPDSVLRTSSEYLFLILQRTQSQGILAIESLSERAFADTDGDGHLEVVDSWGNPIGFYFEMFDMQGNRLDPNFANVTSDLDTAFDVMDDPDVVYPTAHYGLPASNIRMRIISTGNRNLNDVQANVAGFTQWFNLINNLDTLISN